MVGTSDRIAEVARQVGVANSQVATDFQKIVRMWRDLQGIEPLSPDKLQLSGQALQDVRDVVGRIVEHSKVWRDVIGDIEGRIVSLQSDLINTPKELRGLVEGEMGLLRGLDSPDFATFGKMIQDFHDVNSELQKLLSIRSDKDAFQELSVSLEHMIKNVETLDALPFFKQGLTEGVSTLKERLKEIDSNEIEKLQRSLQKIRIEMNESVDAESRGKILGYLTTLKLRLIDFDTGVPPTARLEQLREQLERESRITGGKEEDRIKRSMALKDEIRQAENQAKIYNQIEMTIARYLPLLGEEGNKLNLSAEALARMNSLQKEAIGNYDALAEAKRKDAVQSVIETEILRKREKTEQSRAIDRIRKVGVRSMNNKFLSPVDREEQLMSGTYGDNSFEGGVTSKEYKSFMQTGRRALNELDLLEHYYRQYYRSDSQGQSAFQERTAKKILEETGEQMSPTVLSGVAGALDSIRDIAGNEVIDAIINRREAIRSTMQEAGSFGRVFVNDLYDAIRDQASNLYDQTYDALWGALVTGPRDAEREEEDRMLNKKRQIEDIREMRKEREISSREMRQRLKDIEKDYRKESIRLEQDALIQRERMWDNFFSSIIKGFANVVAETVKARAGLTAGNWLADLLGLDQFPGQGQQSISPQGGFWGDIGSTLTKSGAGDVVKDAIGPILDSLIGNKTGTAETEGSGVTQLMHKLVDQVQGAADPEKIPVSHRLDDLFYERGKDPWIEHKQKIEFPEELYKSVVKVFADKSSVGTGFFVDPNVVATNYHVIKSLIKESGKELWTKSYGPDFDKDEFDWQWDIKKINEAVAVLNKESQIEVPGHGKVPIRSILGIDPANDLALLGVDAIKDIKSFQLKTELPESYDVTKWGSRHEAALLSLGYPKGKGDYPQLDAGYLSKGSKEWSGIRKDSPAWDKTDFVVSGTKAFSGESGSPWIDSITGDVYGMLFGSTRSGGTSAFSTQSKDIQILMDKVRQKTGYVMKEFMADIIEADAETYLEHLSSGKVISLGDELIIPLKSITQLSRELSGGNYEQLSKLISETNGQNGYELSGAGSPFLQGDSLDQAFQLNKLMQESSGASLMDIMGSGFGKLKTYASNVGGQLPHLLALRMVMGTLKGEKGSSGHDFTGKHLPKPFNMFLQDMFGFSFDNPENDMAARKTSFKRANVIARMLGTNTPKDLIKNYETGMAEGFASMSRGAASSDSQGDSDVGKAVDKAIDRQTEAIVDAIAKYSGTHIGDAEVRKVLRTGRGIQREHRSDSNV